MRPEEIKLNYFFDEPNKKIKSEPEYLQYSEEDDCYSELTPDADIQNADKIQNATIQSDEHHEKDQKVEGEADHSIHSKPNKKSNEKNSNNADEHLHYKFYGIVKDGDFLIDSEFD